MEGSCQILVHVIGQSLAQKTCVLSGFLNHLDCRGATRSKVQRALFALAFMEQAGGITGDRTLSKHPLISALVQEHAMSSQGGDTHTVKKAPRTPTAFLLLFECLVCDEPKPVFLRMMAWYRLVRLWTSMRYDDHRGMIPRPMWFVDEGPTYNTKKFKDVRNCRH